MDSYARFNLNPTALTTDISDSDYPCGSLTNAKGRAAEFPSPPSTFWTSMPKVNNQESESKQEYSIGPASGPVRPGNQALNAAAGHDSADDSFWIPQLIRLHFGKSSHPQTHNR